MFNSVNTIKVYIVSRYGLKEKMREQAKILRSHGMIITSTWIDEPHDSQCKLSDVPEGMLPVYARNDIRDLKEADCVIFSSEEPTFLGVRGGRHVEFGYALALGKRIICVGPKENIFHYLYEVEHVSSWSQVLGYLLIH
jgi:nucleoside 2-deoxyribosyltransferase